MKGYKATIEIVAMEGDWVMVENPRSKSGNWEEGTVTQVHASIHRDGINGSFYNVTLDRQLPQYDKWGHERYARGIYVVVGRSSIRLISKAKEAPDGR